MKTPTIRIIFDIIFFLLIFFLPWWISLIIGLGALFFFDNYLEILFFGFCIDSLYAPTIGYAKYIFTTGAFILFCIEILIKSRMRL